MKRFAFFDVDDTLITVKSMFDFFRYWTLEWRKEPAALEAFEREFSRLRAAGESRENLNRAYYRYFAGIRSEDIERAGAAWASAWLARPERFFIAAPVHLLRELMADGVEPVFVSGSFDAVLRPIADHLSVTNILAAPLELRADGCYTGRIGTPQTIGAGKAVAIRNFLAKQKVRADACLAVGDDISDLPMLQSVGTAVVVGEHPQLTEIADARSWRRLPAMAE